MEHISATDKAITRTTALLTFLLITSPVWGFCLLCIYSAFKVEYYALGIIWLTLGIIYGAGKLSEVVLFADLEISRTSYRASRNL